MQAQCGGAKSCRTVGCVYKVTMNGFLSPQGSTNMDVLNSYCAQTEVNCELPL